jgi:hypothetical protein
MDTEQMGCHRDWHILDAMTALHLVAHLNQIEWVRRNHRRETVDPSWLTNCD